MGNVIHPLLFDCALYYKATQPVSQFNLQACKYVIEHMIANKIDVGIHPVKVYNSVPAPCGNYFSAKEFKKSRPTIHVGYDIWLSPELVKSCINNIKQLGLHNNDFLTYRCLFTSWPRPWMANRNFDALYDITLTELIYIYEHQWILDRFCELIKTNRYGSKNEFLSINLESIKNHKNFIVNSNEINNSRLIKFLSEGHTLEYYKAHASLITCKNNPYFVDFEDVCPYNLSERVKKQYIAPPYPVQPINSLHDFSYVTFNISNHWKHGLSELWKAKHLNFSKYANTFESNNDPVDFIINKYHTIDSSDKIFLLERPFNKLLNPLNPDDDDLPGVNLISDNEYTFLENFLCKVEKRQLNSIIYKNI
jgi:hypothetical protein